MNILKMTDEEIKNLVDKIYDANKDELIKMFTDAIEESKNKETKQHKTLSDYRIYEELGNLTDYKFISDWNEIEVESWDNSYNGDKYKLSVGNIYSIDTPNELLEREIKKRQLWFALEKHLKEKGCLATNEDWKDKNIIKYYLLYDWKDNKYSIGNCYYQKANIIFSIDKEVLKNYMNTLIEKDIKIMFDVEV